jgi:hypothetical protein
MSRFRTRISVYIAARALPIAFSAFWLSSVPGPLALHGLDIDSVVADAAGTSFPPLLPNGSLGVLRGQIASDYSRRKCYDANMSTGLALLLRIAARQLDPGDDTVARILAGGYKKRILARPNVSAG